MSVAAKKPQSRLSLAHLSARIKQKVAPATFQGILWMLDKMLIATAIIYPQFRGRLKERNLIAQIKARDCGFRRSRPGITG